MDFAGRSRFKFIIILSIIHTTLDKSLNFLSAIVATSENIKVTSQGCCETQDEYIKNSFFKSYMLLFYHISFF